jgi:cytidine deaminase
MMTPAELIREAKKVVGEFTLAEDFTAGSVAAALVSRTGRLYSGICIDLSCGIGFCAEHSAIAEMLKNRETEIDMIVAVSSEGVLPPCGRCREMMYQINKNNINAKVVIGDERVATLDELLPHRWI